MSGLHPTDAAQTTIAPQSGLPTNRLACLYALVSRLVLPWIILVLAAYMAVHSPLRGWVAGALRMDTRGCFFCAYPLTTQAAVSGCSALCLLAVALIAAWILAQRFDGSTAERVLGFGVLMLGLVAIPAAWIGELASLLSAGWLRPPAGPVLAALPGIVIIVVSFVRGWRPVLPRMQIGRPGGLVWWVGGIGAILMVTSASLSLLHPPTGYDALSYHGPVALFIWQDGNIGAFLDRAPPYWALAHPGTSEIWIGLLHLIGGDALANLGQAPFALLGCAAVYAFARRLGSWRNAALLAAMAFLLAPVVVLQSGMQLNDLTGAALLMAAVALAAAPVQNWRAARVALIGLSLGLAITTKLVLLPGAFAVGLYAVILIAWRMKKERHVWTALLALAGCVLLVAGPWWLRNILHYGNPVFPSALPFIKQGYNFASFAKADLAFVPRRSAWPIYPLLESHSELSGFGALFAVSVLPGLFMAAWRGRRQPLFLFAWVSAVMLVSWWFLSERFPRFLLAPAGLGLAFLPWALLAVPRSLRRAGYALIVAAAIFSALVTYQEALLPFASQPIPRAEFFDQVWGFDPAVSAIPETEGIVWQFGYGTDFPEYTAYIPLLGQTGHRQVLPVDASVTTADVVATMRRAGIRYVYVAASPDNRQQVLDLYARPNFELVHDSAVVKITQPGLRRSLYRPATATEQDQAVMRYLFQLR